MAEHVFVVVCEARADAEMVCRLADRVFLTEVPWLDGILDDLRVWTGAAGADFMTWKQVRQLWDQLRRDRGRRIGGPLHGRYGGKYRGEHLQARKALRLIARERPDASGVILVRDTDRRDLREDYDAARQRESDGPGVALALPDPEREAWLIVGFIPEDDVEARRLKVETSRLGGVPHTIAHTLNPKRDEAPRSTKRVLHALTDGDRARELRCLELSLSLLVERGEDCGLADFLVEVRKRLVPRFSSES